MTQKKPTELDTRIRAITLNYSHIIDLVNSRNGWLYLSLHSEKARARNKIVKLLAEQLKEYDTARMELINKYANKDKNKQPILDEDTKIYSIKDLDKFTEAHDKLLKTEVVFDILPSNRNEFKIVKQLILEGLKREFTYAETEDYEEICSAFETIK